MTAKELTNEYNLRQRNEDVSTLNRIKDLLNNFPPQGDIFGISKEISLFRSNSDKHRADRVLSSVMNFKPKLQSNSLSEKNKHLNNFLTEDQNLTITKQEANENVNIKYYKENFEVKKTKKESLIRDVLLIRVPT